MPTDPERPGPRRLLSCDACGQFELCDPERLLAYSRTGWPRCCGQVMTLFTEAGKPPRADTTMDTPALPPDA